VPKYIGACRKAEADLKRGKRLVQAVVYLLLVGIIAGLVGWINQSYIAIKHKKCLPRGHQRLSRYAYALGLLASVISTPWRSRFRICCTRSR
jgi:hypothetical protein